jgi:hypothetical protein
MPDGRANVGCGGMRQPCGAKGSPGFLGREAGAGASAANGQSQTVTRRQRGPTGVSTRRLTT